MVSVMFEKTWTVICARATGCVLEMLYH